MSLKLLEISALKCGGPDVWSELILSAMLSSNATEVCCGQLSLTRERLSCTVSTEEDERNLMCAERKQDSNCNMQISRCPDGSLNKTCFPVAGSNSLHYMCLCHSALHHQVDNGITATWSTWKFMDISYKQFNFTRKLSSDATAACLVQEYETDPELPEIVNIVAEYTLPDSIFSASSIWRDEHEAYRARIDAYFSLSCAWAAHDYTLPWLQIYLPSSHIFVVTGVLIKQRCDHPGQYVNAITVSTTEAAQPWQEVIKNIYIKDLYGAFDGHQSVTVWFPGSYTTHMWRVYIESYSGHPSMKCDLKGYGFEII